MKSHIEQIETQKYRDGRPEAKLRMDAVDAGIILRSGEIGFSFDQHGARDVWVYESEGTYFMHYDAAGEEGWRCALATSRDLINWTKHGPVLELGRQGESDCASASYGVTFLADDGWHMFYLGTPNASPAPDFVPLFPYLTLKARGTSAFGPWIKQKSIRPFSPQEGTYYGATASPGHILAHEGGYLQYFSASVNEASKGANWNGIKLEGGETLRTLGLARSQDLDATWQVDTEPLLPISEQIENSSLYFESSSNTWFLFTNHIGIDSQGNEFTDAIWVYWSSDLTKWDAENKAIVLDAENCAWSPVCIGLPSVISFQGRLAVFYDGAGGSSKDHMNRHVGLAWLDLPLKIPTQGHP